MTHPELAALRAACERLMAASGLPRVVLRLAVPVTVGGREAEAFVAYEEGHFVFRFGDGRGSMASRQAAELMAALFAAGAAPHHTSRHAGPKAWAGA